MPRQALPSHGAPQLQPNTDTEDEAYRRDGFDPSSSFSGQRTIGKHFQPCHAHWRSGRDQHYRFRGQAAQDFGYRNAMRAACVEKAMAKVMAEARLGLKKSAGMSDK